MYWISLNTILHFLSCTAGCTAKPTSSFVSCKMKHFFTLAVSICIYTSSVYAFFTLNENCFCVFLDSVSLYFYRINAWWIRQLCLPIELLWTCEKPRIENRVCVCATAQVFHSSEQERLQLSSLPVTYCKHLFCVFVCVCVRACTVTQFHNLCVWLTMFACVYILYQCVCMSVFPSRPWGYRQLGDGADGITYDMWVTECVYACVCMWVCVRARLGPSGLPSDRPGLPLLSVTHWGASESRGKSKQHGLPTFTLFHLHLLSYPLMFWTPLKCWMQLTENKTCIRTSRMSRKASTYSKLTAA